MEGARALISILEAVGGRMMVGQRHCGIFGEFSANDGKVFSPFHLWTSNQVSLSCFG
jgi:hypothetical protein